MLSLEFHDCPHCGMKRILPIPDNRCPNCWSDLGPNSKSKQVKDSNMSEEELRRIHEITLLINETRFFPRTADNIENCSHIGKLLIEQKKLFNSNAEFVDWVNKKLPLNEKAARDMMRIYKLDSKDSYLKNQKKRNYHSDDSEEPVAQHGYLKNIPSLVCPHCHAMGVIPMADNRCPNCKQKIGPDRTSKYEYLRQQEIHNLEERWKKLANALPILPIPDKCNSCGSTGKGQNITFHYGIKLGPDTVLYDTIEHFHIKSPIQYPLCNECINRMLKRKLKMPALGLVLSSLALVCMITICLAFNLKPLSVLFYPSLLLVYITFILSLYFGLLNDDSPIVIFTGISIFAVIFGTAFAFVPLPVSQIYIGFILALTLYSIIPILGLKMLFVLWRGTYEDFYLEDYCIKLWKKQNKNRDLDITIWNSKKYKELVPVDPTSNH